MPWFEDIRLEAVVLPATATVGIAPAQQATSPPVGSARRAPVTRFDDSLDAELTAPAAVAVPGAPVATAGASIAVAGASVAAAGAPVSTANPASAGLSLPLPLCTDPSPGGENLPADGKPVPGRPVEQGEAARGARLSPARAALVDPKASIDLTDIPLPPRADSLAAETIPLPGVATAATPVDVTGAAIPASSPTVAGATAANAMPDAVPQLATTLAPGTDPREARRAAPSADATAGRETGSPGGAAPVKLAPVEAAPEPITPLDGTSDPNMPDAGRRDAAVVRETADPGTERRAAEVTRFEAPAAFGQPLQAPVERPAATDPTVGATDGSLRPTESRIVAETGTERWQQELGQRLVESVTHGARELRLSLHPEHLGPLEVRLRLHESQVGVWFGTASAEVRDALQDSLPRLREMLAEGGLNMAGASVGHQHDGAPGRALPWVAGPEVDDPDTVTAVALPVAGVDAARRATATHLLDAYA